MVSVPVVGSVTAIDCRRSSPEAISGRYLRFCASEPWRSSVPMLYIWPWQAPELPPQRLISSMMTEASARPESRSAVFLGNQRGEPAGFGQGGDERFRIGARGIDLAEIRVRKVRAQRAHGGADLGMGLALCGSSTAWPAASNERADDAAPGELAHDEVGRRIRGQAAAVSIVISACSGAS